MKLIILLFLFGLTSCSYYFHPPSIEKKTEKEYSYKRNKHYKTSKWRKNIRKIGYERFDEKGRLIEEGRYGEYFHYSNMSKDADNSMRITLGHGRIYKNLDRVHYYSFDSIGRKVKDELWQYKDNKKSYLINKTFFEYDAYGGLIREIEYDENDKASELLDNSREKSNNSTTKDSIVDKKYKCTVEVDGNSREIIITDSLGRPIEKMHYYNDKFSYRNEYRYESSGKDYTELRYHDKPDSLWSITERKFDIITKKPVRVFSKIIGSTEEKDIYIYNRKKLLIKIKHYQGEELRYFTKYKYKLYK